MGLSARERVGSRRLLQLLETADLFSLSGTVTKKKSTAYTRTGAIDLILENSLSAYELLKRKKVLRDIIATYLQNEGIPITPRTTKAELIQKTLGHWNEQNTFGAFIPLSIAQKDKASASDVFPSYYIHTSELSSYNLREDARKIDKTPDFDEIIATLDLIQVTDPPTSSIITTKEKLTPTMSFQQRHKVSSDVPLFPLSSGMTNVPMGGCETKDTKEQKSTPHTLEPQTGTQMTNHIFLQTERQPENLSKVKTGKAETTSYPHIANVTHMTTRSMLKTEHQPANSEKEKIKQTEHVAAASHPGNTQIYKRVHQHPIVQEKENTKEAAKSPPTDAQEEEDASRLWPVDCEKFSREFCEWFFTLLNSQHPSSKTQLKGWGPQHLLGKAILQLSYMSDVKKYNGPRNASSRLLALVQEEKLFFQPNINSNGAKCERSPEGMVVVTVDGTIFRNNSYLGTFHQVFEVVGQSRTKKWKIRYVDLKIQKSS
ncbi:uncharacterized protein [Engystomops pustulosus]|uniref:uncharacterized protein isoform X1 n=1 Tax=Engystomops pustulosus TaxID=76066 RepID=UPI003AFA08BC